MEDGEIYIYIYVYVSILHSDLPMNNEIPYPCIGDPKSNTMLVIGDIPLFHIPVRCLSM